MILLNKVIKNLLKVKLLIINIYKIVDGFINNVYLFCYY